MDAYLVAMLGWNIKLRYHPNAYTIQVIRITALNHCLNVYIMVTM